MAEINLGGVYTLVDLVKILNPTDGQALFVAQTLARSNPIVREVPIVEANQILQHIGSRQKSLPTVQKRAINAGVPQSAHKEEQVTAPMSLFETASQIDEEILRLAGANAETVRQRKDAAFIEAMTQAVADEIIYGSIGDDVLGFNGLATLFDSTTVYPNGDSSWYYNVIDEGGTGSDTTSIWIIEWGVEKAHLIYPKNTMAGIEINDMGKQWVVDSGGTNKFWAFVTQFKWRCGLYVQDQRCVGRLANIESAGSTNTFDEDNLIRLIERLPRSGEDSMTRIYCNRTVKTQMRIRAKDKANMHWTDSVDALSGKPVLRFDGIPVQVCDAILNAETAIS